MNVDILRAGTCIPLRGSLSAKLLAICRLFTKNYSSGLWQDSDDLMSYLHDSK